MALGFACLSDGIGSGTAVGLPTAEVLLSGTAGLLVSAAGLQAASVTARTVANARIDRPPHCIHETTFSRRRRSVGQDSFMSDLMRYAAYPNHMDGSDLTLALEDVQVMNISS